MCVREYICVYVNKYIFVYMNMYACVCDRIQPLYHFGELSLRRFTAAEQTEPRQQGGRGRSRAVEGAPRDRGKGDPPSPSLADPLMKFSELYKRIMTNVNFRVEKPAKRTLIHLEFISFVK